MSRNRIFRTLHAGTIAASWLVAAFGGAVNSPLSAADPLPAGTLFADEAIVLPPGSAGAVGEPIRQGPVFEGNAPLAGPRSEPIVAPPEFGPFGDGMRIDAEPLDEMPYEASSGDWFWNGGWYVGAESLWLDRSRNNRKVLAIDRAAPNVAYTTTSQPFAVAPGARLTLGKSLGRDYLDRDRSVEFVYYGGLSWKDTDGWQALVPGSIVTPLNPFAPGFNGATQFDTSMASDFNSWEFNYKLHRRLGRDQLVMSPGGNWTKHAERGWLPSLILGIRTATVNEQFSMLTSRPGTAPSDFVGHYAINTSNWLLGMNLGGELISQNEFYYWGLRGRAAPALSFTHQSQQANGVNKLATPPLNPDTITINDSGDKSGPGFIGDLTLLAGWHITPNFSLQLGYDFLWVAGIATATRQFNLDATDNNSVDPGGQTFYNGLSFGFYGSW